MAENYANLQKMSVADLIKQYDETAVSTAIGLNFIREELARREVAAQNEQMIKFTKQVRDMTLAIVALTVVVTIVTAVNLYLVA